MNYSSDESLFSPTATHSKQALFEPTPGETSWIGARMSPIASFDQEDDDARASSERRKRPHEEILTETSRLLPSFARQPAPSNDKPEEDRSSKSSTFYTNARHLLLTGSYYTVVIVYDLLVVDSDQRPWTLAGMTPSSLRRCGALSPYDFQQEHYWRMITALLLPVSLWDYMWILWIHTLAIPYTVEREGKTYGVIYLLCALTGQLWMFAFDQNADILTTSALAASTGLVAAVASTRTTRRSALCLLIAILWVYALGMVPYASIYNLSGAALAGGVWAPRRVGKGASLEIARLSVGILALLVPAVSILTMERPIYE